MSGNNLTENEFSGLGLPDKKLTEKIQSFAKPFQELMAYYRCAMMEVETKFKVLSEELSLEYDHNPIETIKTRLKSVEGITKKLHRKNLPIEVKSIENNIFDVAGIRVICSFISDIDTIAEAFLRQDDIKLIERKDYINNPKQNGYRSLHLIVEIPIFLHDEKKMMKVEVQFRTISMDWWASLEHKIRYKKDVTFSPEQINELHDCAESAAALDAKMEQIRKSVITGGNEK